MRSSSARASPTRPSARRVLAREQLERGLRRRGRARSPRPRRASGPASRATAARRRAGARAEASRPSPRTGASCDSSRRRARSRRSSAGAGRAPATRGKSGARPRPARSPRGTLRGARRRAATAPGALEHLRHDALEEDDAARRPAPAPSRCRCAAGFEVQARLGEQARYLPLAREHGGEPLFDRSVGALEDVIDGGGDEAVVEVRVAPPHPHVFEFEQLRARVRRGDEVVVARLGRQAPLGDARQLREHAAQAPRLGRDRRGVAHFELRVELVEASRRGLRRVEGVVAAHVRISRSARRARRTCGSRPKRARPKRRRRRRARRLRRCADAPPHGHTDAQTTSATRNAGNFLLIKRNTLGRARDEQI